MHTIQRLVFLSLSIGMFLLSHVLVAQGNKVELIKEDGTILKGYAKIHNKSLSYRQNMDERYKRFKMLDFVTIHIHSKDEGKNTYKRIDINGRKKPKMMIPVVEGAVALYREESKVYTSGYGAGIGFHGNAGQSFGGTSYAYKRLYLKRGSNERAIRINVSSKNKFKNAIERYFRSCPELIDKVETGEFSKKQLKEIVEFYNNHCKK